MNIFKKKKLKMFKLYHVVLQEGKEYEQLKLFTELLSKERKEGFIILPETLRLSDGLVMVFGKEY